MPVYIARSECREGFWHVVTYDISNPAKWVEVEDLPTPQPCSEQPTTIAVSHLTISEARRRGWSNETGKLTIILEEKIAKDGSEHIPGERCVEGLVGGVAIGVAPVTDRDKKKAEEAVKAAGLASAIAAAQTKCDKGTCKDKAAKCTFVKMIEASVVTSTPSRDSQGRIQWTAALDSFEVAGPCTCQS